MKKIFAILFLASFLTPHVFASGIKRLKLTELTSKSDYIVLGKVIKVEAKDEKDKVTIKIGSQLKGELKEKTLTFILTTRGGLKDFDPKLNVGNTGVFFLKNVNGKIEKAYWGSIATFNKNHFDLD